MPKSDLLYLGHMLDTAHQIMGKLRGKNRDEFDEDDNLRLAVAHLLQMLGESSRRITEEARQAHPEVPWGLIIGMRHKIVHATWMWTSTSSGRPPRETFRVW